MGRFEPKNKRLLMDALRQQQTLGCNEGAIRRIAGVARVKNYDSGTRLIIQGSDDNDLAFILSGRVIIEVKGEKVAERSRGQHVGEMSIIDPSSRRSATVVAIERTTVAWIKERDFSKIAASYPDIWRTLACELADRLRQRAALVRDRNYEPIIFIGSSSESLKIAQRVARALSNDPISVNLWKRGVFTASESTIESLEKMARSADFAILILTADDKIRTRKRNVATPRDNILFELGLFMGAISRQRTFILREATPRLRLPPDLKGVTYLPFRMKNRRPLAQDINQAVAEVRKLISELNVR